MQGLPYIYGGQSGEGLDCSGLIIETFRRMGIPIRDMNAAEIRTHLFTLSEAPSVGPCLQAIFQRDPDNGSVIHVASLLTDTVVFHTTNSLGHADFQSLDEAFGSVLADIHIGYFDVTCLFNSANLDNALAKSMVENVRKRQMT
jgi:hypothetical protein